jgi:hypothetical protein
MNFNVIMLQPVNRRCYVGTLFVLVRRARGTVGVLSHTSSACGD